MGHAKTQIAISIVTAEVTVKIGGAQINQQYSSVPWDVAGNCPSLTYQGVLGEETLDLNCSLATVLHDWHANAKQHYSADGKFVHL